MLQQLDDLPPLQATQFIARAGEGYLGSDGDDGNAEYWRAVCQLVGIRFDDFGSIELFPELRPIRAYWQGGLYSYDRTTRFAAAQFEIMRALLSGNIGSKVTGVFHQDQVSIALTCQKLQLTHSQYRPEMNFNLSPFLEKEYTEIVPMLANVKILYHHNSLYRSAF